MFHPIRQLVPQLNRLHERDSGFAPEDLVLKSRNEFKITENRLRGGERGVEDFERVFFYGHCGLSLSGDSAAESDRTKVSMDRLLHSCRPAQGKMRSET